jgi:RNA polymerase sigma factor (sigma-70 family)
MVPGSEGGLEDTRLTQTHDAVQPERSDAGLERESAPSETHRSFDDRFVELFNRHYLRLFRYLDRLSGDPDLAADVAQDAFVRLYRRGAVPDTPGGWLVSVAMNLFRNAKSTQRRRLRLLTPALSEGALGDATPAPNEAVEADETRQRVRSAIDRLPERERRMLLLRAEGYSYHEIATTLGIHEASIGTLLARAKREFRQCYEDAINAPE